jgi:hypothetical protein
MVLLRAKEATLLIGTTIASPSATATFYSQLTGVVDFSGRCKSIEISGAEADTETVYLFGSDANGRQNAETEEQNMSDREFSGTLVYTDNIPASWATGAAVSVGSTGYTRVQGDGARTERCLVFKLEDSAGAVGYVSMNNALFTKMGDISLDAEGHMEQEVTAKCKAKDYYEEYTA